MSQNNYNEQSYALSGPSPKTDKRITPIRGDLADISLAGKLFAPHYAVPQLRICVTSATMVRAAPDHLAQGASSLSYGEEFAVLDISGDWAWGYCKHDDYLGYVPTAHLAIITEEMPKPTHIVTSVSSMIYTQPKGSATSIVQLPMGAKICITGDEEDGFLPCAQGYMPASHLSLISDMDVDPVALARRLINVPYCWGGRSGFAIDCSGLVQLCFGMNGKNLPRDSDMQEAFVGRQLDDRNQLRVGDLVFFNGHVGIMADKDNIIHANSYHMNVTIEPLSIVAQRFASEDGPAITSMKRI
ncbi:C40 family peptidase [Sphingorhabdus lutea]|nr:C40 family peptidase [Sphingorhabdus lutea]